jgi:hypothetical protein
MLIRYSMVRASKINSLTLFGVKYSRLSQINRWLLSNVIFSVVGSPNLLSSFKIPTTMMQYRMRQRATTISTRCQPDGPVTHSHARRRYDAYTMLKDKGPTPSV